MIKFNGIDWRGWEYDMFKIKRWSKIPESEKFLPPEEGMKRVTQGNFAYHSDPDTTYKYIPKYFNDQMICKMNEVHMMKKLSSSFYAHRRSPFIEMMKVG